MAPCQKESCEFLWIKGSVSEALFELVCSNYNNLKSANIKKAPSVANCKRNDVSDNITLLGVLLVTK